jgi:hypothetical protein
LIPTQGRLFFTSETHVVISSVSSPSDTTRSLSAEGHSCFDNNIPLSLLRRSLARSVCSDVPTGQSCLPPPAARSLRVALNFSPQKVGAVAGRPAARVRRRKGPQRTSTAPSLRDTASDPPPRPRSPRRNSLSRWKLIGPFY